MKIRVAAALLLTVGLNGCAAIPLAALGSALGIAGSVAGTGADVYSSGKLDSAEPVSLDELRAALLAAADDLGFHAIGAKTEKRAYVLRLADDRDATIDVTLDPRTPTLTRMRINVGVFGSEPTAKLLLQRIRALIDDASNPIDEADLRESQLVAGRRSRLGSSAVRMPSSGKYAHT